MEVESGKDSDMGRSALLIIDMQEDFCAVDGAYARGGMDISATRAIMPVVEKLVGTAKEAGIPQIATLFTIFEDVDGRPMIAPHLLKHRPFLQETGFRVQNPGRQYSTEMRQPSHTITKPRYSAFYQTPLDILLRSMQVTEVAVCGITANGGVAATVRDAHLRDLPTTVISDGVASFTEEAKSRALLELSTIAQVVTADEWVAKRHVDSGKMHGI